MLKPAWSYALVAQKTKWSYKRFAQMASNGFRNELTSPKEIRMKIKFDKAPQYVSKPASKRGQAAPRKAQHA